MGYVVPAVITTITPSDSLLAASHFPGAPVIDRFAPGLRFDQGQGGPLQFPRQLCVRSTSRDAREGSSTPAPDSLVSSVAFAKTTQTRLPLTPAFASSLYDALRTRFMLGDRTFDPPRFDPDISIKPGGFPTKDSGVSLDRTLTG
ncbi:hypothetical protein [Ferrimicrobium acidiphilum]|uniref:hypothetical protein n=1 Tax=Ferrimicrobium acidiphilum TaxID=121039 RepID=UPI0023EFCC85|nr:hypothetical protein [Ferrimicrobium acidiphilum]